MSTELASAARFESEIARYHHWREELAHSVTAYHDWLESNGQLDVQQSIKFYDLLENLNKGKLMLAFLAEYSRGKSELINALFFSGFKERLLPSNVGRTTMCPTEIFHDPTEEPYLKLLSVETRYRDDSIAQLKNNPVEWSKVRLNVHSAADMKKTLSALADTKQVYALEARMLGLAPAADARGQMPGEEELVEVPAWRYAMINYPHPLLSNGLSVLDTPGLNALGAEPELTVSTLPSAHAILFLLSIDTGVTRSDLEIWDRYVKPGLPQKLAVLNKIDLMWDELKTPEEIAGGIQRMVDTTAKTLALDPGRVFPLSAQKALLGRIKEDDALVKRSGIEALENFLATEIVPMRQQILCRAVRSEIGSMMVASRATILGRQQANDASVAEMQTLVGKSREVAMQLWAKVSAEKTAYNAALAEYKVNHARFAAKRTALMEMLNPAKLDKLLAGSAQAIEDSWTTIALQRGMRQLSRVMSEDFERVYLASEDIKKLMQGVYDTFIEKFAFQKMKVPSLELELHHTKLRLLVTETDAFAKDPLNVLGMEKHFLVKKFYRTLVNQAKANFNDARIQSERWLQEVTLPLETQMKDHKQLLQTRLDHLSKIKEKSTSINEKLAELSALAKSLTEQRAMIEGLIERVAQGGPADAEEVPEAAPAAPAEPEVLIASPFDATAPLAPEDSPLTITTRAARAQEVFREIAHVKEEEPPVPLARPVPPSERTGAPPPRPKPHPGAARPGEEPMISDDLLAAFSSAPAADGESAPEAQRTQRLPKMKPGGFNPFGARRPEGAQPEGADRTVRLDKPVQPDGADKTVRLAEPVSPERPREK